MSSGTRTVEVCVIGAGISGICAGVKLRQNGIDNFVILEKEGDIGGTWRDNIYPGCKCDLPFVLYSFSFMPTFNSALFEDAPKIHEYLQSVVDEFLIRSFIELNRNVVKIQWRNNDLCWEVHYQKENSEQISIILAKHLISGTGLLSIPKFPPFFSVEEYNKLKENKETECQIVHTATWEKDIDVRGKKVAVVGNGSSGMQVAEATYKDVESTHLFIRSPKIILHKQVQYIPEFILNLPIASFIRSAIFLVVEIVNVYITLPYLRNAGSLVISLLRLFLSTFMYLGTYPVHQMLPNAMKRRVLNETSLSEEVSDQLNPQFPVGCNRLIFESDYFDALASDKVTAVCEGVEGIDIKTGTLKTKTQTHSNFDLIVFATGFQINRCLPPFPVYGNNGLTLDKAWEQRPRSLYGITTPQFPNFYRLYGAHTNPLLGSATFFIECGVNYIVSSILNQRNITKKTDSNIAFDVKEEKVNEYYDKDLLPAMVGRPEFAKGCNNWYIDKTNTVAQSVYDKSINFPGSMMYYWWLTRKFNINDYNLVDAA